MLRIVPWDHVLKLGCRCFLETSPNIQILLCGSWVEPEPFLLWLYSLHLHWPSYHSSQLHLQSHTGPYSVPENFRGEGGRHLVACGILFPRPGIEPRPSTVRPQIRSPNHWTTRYFPHLWKIQSHSQPSFVHQSSLVTLIVQSLSCVRLVATPWTAACQAPLSSAISQSLLKFMSIEAVILPNHLILYCPFLLPSISPSFRVFSSESALCIRWPKDWSFSFSIDPSSEYSALISFRINWFDHLAVCGTLKSLLQRCSSKASVFQRSVFLWSSSHIHKWLLEEP